MVVVVVVVVVWFLFKQQEAKANTSNDSKYHNEMLPTFRLIASADQRINKNQEKENRNNIESFAKRQIAQEI